jgi:hypothetical protein
MSIISTASCCCCSCRRCCVSSIGSCRSCWRLLLVLGLAFLLGQLLLQDTKHTSHAVRWAAPWSDTLQQYCSPTGSAALKRQPAHVTTATVAPISQTTLCSTPAPKPGLVAGQPVRQSRYAMRLVPTSLTVTCTDGNSPSPPSTSLPRHILATARGVDSPTPSPHSAKANPHPGQRDMYRELPPPPPKPRHISATAPCTDSPPPPRPRARHRA